VFVLLLFVVVKKEEQSIGTDRNTEEKPIGLGF